MSMSGGGNGGHWSGERFQITLELGRNVFGGECIDGDVPCGGEGTREMGHAD